jgi:hypothetical protein
MSALRKILIFVAFVSGAAIAQPNDELTRLFAQPPASAKPLTWWHWLDGNITREGITGDLEAMQRVGLGGALMFNASVGFPEGPVRFMQPEWLAMMDHTLRETKRLGLTFGIHNCDGFSQSGGPWITPATSMKQLTWSVAEVEGPRTIDLTLATPASNEGFYRDIGVIAFPAPSGATLTGPGTATVVHGSVGDAALARLVDGDPATTAAFPVNVEKGHTVEFVFTTPQTVRSIVCRNAGPHTWELDFPIAIEVSSDGKNFRNVGEFTANWDFANGGRITAACEEATGTVFRLTFRNPWPLTIGEIELSETARVHFGEAKAAWMRSRGPGAERRHHDAYPGPARDRTLAPELTVARAAVQNLTAQMDATGRLQWNVPPGKWRIARVGFTSNGTYVHPATREGRGLECDKLDARVVREHLEAYVGRLKARSDQQGAPILSMELDSWECGVGNWTAGFEQRFAKSLGYDLLPFMPALIEGWIVENPDVTERVLWDWRRFLADQFAENYFAVVADVAEKKGLTYVGESNGRQQYLYDTAWMRHPAVPMGEMWTNTEVGQGVRVDNKAAASFVHITGKTRASVEAYTSGDAKANWDDHPFTLKALGDKAFCAGINEFIFHTYAHQPYETTGPGFTFGRWGLNFNRGNTWWEPGRAWMEYLTRCNFLLRQGHFVADVLWFVGEDVPNFIGWREDLRPVLPRGYDFDGCDLTALMQATVKGGRIVLPSGMSYRVLLLPSLPTMRPAVLRQIKHLADAGAVILGPRPRQSPSYRDLGAGDATVRQLVGELWDGAKPRVRSALGFEELFQQIGLSPDFTYRADATDAEILYIHRRTSDAEVYFISNQKNRAEEIVATFRAGDRAPEWWDPATGETRTLPEFNSAGDTVRVPLRLDPWGSGFVVFRGDRQPAEGRNWPALKVAQTITGAWKVSFPPKLGAPAFVSFDRLESFTARPESGIRFFSGTATYEKEITLTPAQIAAPGGIHLDLGAVEVMAEVELNGRNLGVLWKPPYRVRVDGAARAGVNQLVVRVTTLWRNRLIGDEALPQDDIEWATNGRRGAYPAKWPDWLVKGRERPSGRVTYYSRKDAYLKSDALVSSGLIGPVTLQIQAGESTR